MSVKEMLGKVEQFVNRESGTYNKDGVDDLGAMLTEWFSELGFEGTKDVQKERGDNLFFHYRGSTNPKIILLAHMDTVFKKGTVEKRPFTRDDNYAYGPGVFDMKGSIAVLHQTLSEFKNDGEEALLRNVSILFNSDEEVGSIHSRAFIEKHSADKEYALILEPSRDKEVVCNARKGGGKYYLHIHGKGAHAGMAHQEGESAVQEIALLIPKLHALTNYEEGITVNVGLIEGGTSVNTVAPYAYAGIDLRIETLEQAEQLDKQIREIIAKPVSPAIRFELEERSGISRPPLIPTGKSNDLLNQVKEVGRAFGWSIRSEKTGGGSDGNLTSFIGIPTIDGLGPIGGNAHQEDEFLEISSLEERKEFLKELIRKLSQA